MATISWLGDGTTLQAGSGFGLYGDSGFGASVTVGAFQGRTYITNGAGTYQGPEVDNVKYLNSQSGILGQTGTGIALTAIPNQQATMQIHFNHSSAIQVQNAKLYIYDRSSINNDPTGVTCYTAEIIHPTITQANNGSGDTVWVNTHGSGQTLSLCNSPGTSGQFAGNGSNGGIASTDHDWWVALSASPNSIGSKTLFGCLVSLEYY